MVRKYMSGRPKTFSDEELLKRIDQHKEPFCTATELAKMLEVTNSAVLKRLKTLEESGEIESKNVGSRAKVWWIPDS